MRDLKSTSAPTNTTTIDKNLVDAPTNNIYEAISIISKRAVQVNSDIKKELLEKLDEFATYNDSLEEIFELSDKICVINEGVLSEIFDVREITATDVGLLMGGKNKKFQKMEPIK